MSWLSEVFARYGNPAIIVSAQTMDAYSPDDFEQFVLQRDILHWKQACRGNGNSHEMGILLQVMGIPWELNENFDHQNKINLNLI